MAIQIKRGLSTNFAAVNLAAGEPAFTTDDKKFYIGTGTEKVLINPAAPSFENAALSGTPTAPTAIKGTNTTQIATTSYVMAALGDYVKTDSNIDGGTF
jgi:hypothetical protein